MSCTGHRESVIALCLRHGTATLPDQAGPGVLHASTARPSVLRPGKVPDDQMQRVQGQNPSSWCSCLIVALLQLVLHEDDLVGHSRF